MAVPRYVLDKRKKVSQKKYIEACKDDAELPRYDDHFVIKP